MKRPGSCERAMELHFRGAGVRFEEAAERREIFLEKMEGLIPCNSWRIGSSRSIRRLAVAAAPIRLG